MAVTHVSSGLRCLNGPATKAVNRKGGAFDKTSRILCMFSHVTVPEESVLELFQAKIFSRLCVPEEITLAWWFVNTPQVHRSRATLSSRLFPAVLKEYWHVSSLEFPVLKP